MRKIARKFGFLLLTGLMVISLAAGTLAAETVEVDGYAGSQGAGQFTISNVAQKASQDYLEGDPTYICSAPAVVTTSADLAEFYVAPIEEVDDSIELGKDLSVEGSCVAYNDMFEKKTMTCKEAEEDQSYIICAYQKGAKVTIDKPGTYFVSGSCEAIEGSAEAVIIIPDTAPAAPASAKATPTSAKVLVNGTATAFDAYNIGGNNFFKLRDFAKAVSGSDKQFEVAWDGSKNAINLVSGKAYTPVGGEFAKGDGAVKTASASTSSVYKDGAEISLTAYNIGGNNYFKLRDLAKAFNIGVTYDNGTQTIGIDTSTGYSE